MKYKERYCIVGFLVVSLAVVAFLLYQFVPRFMESRLISKMSSDDAEEVLHAIDGLQRMRSLRSIPVFLERLDELYIGRIDVELTRKMPSALDAIIEYRGESAIPYLVECLRRGDHALSRMYCLRQLAKFGMSASRWIPDVMRLLDDSDSCIRMEALSAIGAIGRGSQICRLRLINALNDADEMVSFVAARNLETFLPKPIELRKTFARLMESENAEIAKYAADALKGF